MSGSSSTIRMRVIASPSPPAAIAPPAAGRRPPGSRRSGCRREPRPPSAPAQARPRSRAPAPSPRLKRSNTASSRSGGSPGPVSASSTTAIPSSARPPTATDAPRPAYLAAFSNRPAKTWRSQSASPVTIIAGSSTHAVTPARASSGVASESAARTAAARSTGARSSSSWPLSDRAILQQVLDPAEQPQRAAVDRREARPERLVGLLEPELGLAEDDGQRRPAARARRRRRSGGARCRRATAGRWRG